MHGKLVTFHNGVTQKVLALEQEHQKRTIILEAIQIKSTQNTMSLDGGLKLFSIWNQFLGFY